MGNKILKNNLVSICIYIFIAGILFFIIIIALFKTPAILSYSREYAFIQPGSELNLRGLCQSEFYACYDVPSPFVL